MIATTVICVDFDGTLVDSQGRIHPNDVMLLRNEHSVIFIPATGRGLASVRRTFANNGLFARQAVPFPLVLQNGAALYGPDEDLRRHHVLPPAMQAALLAVARAHPRVTTYFFGLQDLYEMWPSAFSATMVQRFDLEPRPFDEAGADTRFIKLMCICDDPAALAALADAMAGLPVVQAYSMPTVMEVNQAGINKGDGAAELLSALGLGRARMIAAGDGENDLVLFARAELAFATSTSLPHVKAQAGAVIDVTQEGLLAPILRRL